MDFGKSTYEYAMDSRTRDGRHDEPFHGSSYGRGHHFRLFAFPGALGLRCLAFKLLYSNTKTAYLANFYEKAREAS